MKLGLSLHALWILDQLQKAGYEAYMVGGSVRDSLLKHHSPTSTIPKHPLLYDYDFTTNATPEQIQAVFPDSYYENQFGTVSLTYDHVNAALGRPLTDDQLHSIQTIRDPRPKIIDSARATKIHVSLRPDENHSSSTTPKLQTPSFQITTYRADEIYDNHRHPSSMTWGKSLQEDLTRRDFTINALAIQLLSKPVFPTDEKLTLEDFVPEVEVSLIDHHGGLDDLKAGLIRAVGSAPERFHEDALRMLRAIRFSVQLNFEIEPETFAALSSQHALLAHISPERIRDELLKMLATEYPAEAIALLDETQLLSYVLPELLSTKAVEQSGHHTTDVWVHSLDSLRWCPSPDPIVRLATLLHDIAKPDTQQSTGENFTFYNHEIIGARIAKKVGQRLHLSRAEVEKLFILVRYHMFHYQPENTDAAIRRLMRQVGLEHLDDLLDLREGDRLGSGARKTSWRLEELKARMIEQLHQPMDVTDLAIDGHDLMTELALKPGPILGTLLQGLLEKVLDNPSLNSREQLLAEAKILLASGTRPIVPSQE